MQGRKEMKEGEAGDSLPTSRLLGRVKVTPSSSVRKDRRKVCRRRRKGRGLRFQTTF